MLQGRLKIREWEEMMMSQKEEGTVEREEENKVRKGEEAKKWGEGVMTGEGEKAKIEEERGVKEEEKIHVIVIRTITIIRMVKEDNHLKRE